MANFSATIDLLALMGAQYVMGKKRPKRKNESDESYDKVPMVPGIFIPAPSNCIEVKRDDARNENYRNKCGYKADVRLYMYQYSNDNNYIKSIRDGIISRGETPDEYNMPFREVKLSLDKDVSAALLEAYKKVVVASHPEWATLDFNDKDNPEVKKFRNAVYAFMPTSNRLGSLYLLHDKSAASAPAPVPQPSAQYPWMPVEMDTAQPSQDYQAQAQQPAEAQFDDVLPF